MKRNVKHRRRVCRPGGPPSPHTATTRQLSCGPQVLVCPASCCPAPQVIDLGDAMEFTPTPYATADTLECSDPTIPSDDRNLVIKVRQEAHSYDFACTA